MYEEKFIAKYNSHPLKVVGSEGIFGFLALILIQVAMYFIIIPGFQLGDNPDGRLEDPLGNHLNQPFKIVGDAKDKGNGSMETYSALRQ